MTYIQQSKLHLCPAPCFFKDPFVCNLESCQAAITSLATWHQTRHGALEKTVWREFRGRNPGLAAEAKKRLNSGLPTDQLVADAPCDGTKFATGIRSCLFCEINLPNWETCRMLAVNIPGWFLPDCCGCGCVLLCNGRRVSVVGSRN